MNSEAQQALTGGMGQYEAFIKPSREAMQRSAEARSELASLQGRMEADRNVARARDIAGAEETFARQMREAPQRQELERVSQRMEEPFIPTRDNAARLATIFALTNIAGFAMGSGGKRNAQGAMSAMNGMLEGYQRGRMDLYKKEKDVFDTNMKQLKMRYDTLDRQLREALETYKTDKQAGIAKAEIAYAQAGADFQKNYAEKFGLAAAFELHKQAYDTANRMWAERTREEQRAEEQRRRAEAEDRARRREERDISRFERAMSGVAGAGRQVAAGKQKIFQGNDGKMYTLDARTNSLVPVNRPPGVESLTEVGGRSGQNALTFASRVYGNIENAAADLANIVALPQTSQLPIFSGLLNVERATSLGSLESLVGRKITNQENRAFQQVSDQLGAALARMEAQGLATGATKANIASFNSLRPGQGDDAINMALYIARVKQEIQTGVRVHEKMPGATSEQKQATTQILERLNQVVPFDVDDVLQTLRKKKGQLGDKMTRLVQQPPIASGLALGQMQAPPAPETRGAAPASTAAQSTTRKERARPGEQIFQDSNENKAVKRNGQWVEVE